ncbi:MAG: CPBP family intramembrane metalloprotease [Bacteroidales bacterium]|nr:CPBP family intramembrane metalloprotease [Bacteroidales bacterium]
MTLLSFREMKPFSRLMFSAFIVVVVFLGIQFLAALAAIPLFGMQQVTGMLTGLNTEDPETLRMLKYFQTVQALGLFIAPSFLIAWLFSAQPLRYLALDRKAPLLPALMVILLVFVINPFINFTGEINGGMHFPPWLEDMEEWMRTAEENAERLTRAFLEVETTGGLLFNLLMVAVLPAIGEELLFRGVIQKQLSAWSGSHHWGIWLSAALFSALHMQFYGFLPRMLLGALFGYLLVWSGSLWLPILAHFINNAGAVLALWLIGRGKLSPAVEEFGAGAAYWPWAIASLTVGLLILGAIRHQLREFPVFPEHPTPPGTT